MAARRYAAAVFLWLFVTVSTVAAAPPSPAVADLRQKIDTLLKSTALSQSHAGVKIVSLKTGEVLYAKDDKLLTQPASTLKLFTTAAALSALGEGFRFNTAIYANSSDIRDGALTGNLYLRGSADPTLTTESLSWFAAELKAKGVERISGSLICDETYLDDWHYGKGWMWDDASSCFFAPIGGLTVNNNCVTVRIRPAFRAGMPAVVVTEPKTAYITIENAAITISSQEEGDVKAERKWRQRQNVIAVTGDIAVGRPQRNFSIEITNPASYTCRLFSELLAANNISVAGEVKEGAVPNDAPELLRHSSSPLSEIIKEINKKSINLYAELLMKALGAELQSPPGTAEKGIAAIKEFLKGMGIDTARLVIADGSGVSSYNLVSPSQLVSLLTGIYQNDRLRETFVESLSIAGVDGTLKSRMKSTPAEGRVRAKTGLHTSVSTIAGYTETQDGDPVAFAIMMEDFIGDPSYIKDIQDRIVVLVSSFSRSK